MQTQDFKVTDEMVANAQNYSDKLKADPMGEAKKVVEEAEVAVKNFQKAILPVLDSPNCTGNMLLTTEIRVAGMEANLVILPLMMLLLHPKSREKFGHLSGYEDLRKRAKDLTSNYDTIMTRVATLNGKVYTPLTQH